MNKEELVKISYNASLVSGVFTVLVAIIMLFNYLQISATDPLETESIEILTEQMRDNPRNEELKNEIRTLDLMARRAYFNNQWQIKTGRYLLLFGAIVFLISVRYFSAARASVAEPHDSDIPLQVERLLSQRWLFITTAAFFLIAFLSTFAVTNHLETYNLLAESEPASAAETADEEIQTIQVKPAATEEERIDAPADDQPADPETSAEGEAADAETPVTAEADAPAREKEAGNYDFPSLAEIRENHNSFRGPLGQGVSYHEDIPVEWDGASGKNILWKTQLPRPGYNSPVIWENRLFVAGGDATVRVVYCLDRNTGKVLWEQEVTGIPGAPDNVPKTTEDTGLSAPTLTTDGRNVYAIFATGNIIAFSMEGEKRWGRNLGVPNNHYGHSSSLLVWGNKVLVQYDTFDGGRVLALETTTGNILWDHQRDAGISWASPILAEINGTYQMILSADPIVAGYDVETGEELWSVTCMMGEVGPSPAFAEGIVYAGQEYARLVAIDPAGPEPTIIWEDDYYMPEVASPVAAGGLLFVATSYGVLACYDGSTGEMLWEAEFNQGFYSSPVIADGKLYAMDMDGVMHIYKVSRQAELLGEPALGEIATSTPAFSEGRIYIRGDHYLYCIGHE